MCDNQSLRTACAYAQSDQSLRLSFKYSLNFRLLTEHHLEFLSLLEITCHAHIMVIFDHHSNKIAVALGLNTELSGKNSGTITKAVHTTQSQYNGTI